MNKKKIMVLIVSSVIFCASFQAFIFTTKAESSDKHYNNFFVFEEKELIPYFNYAKEAVEGYYIISMSNIESPEKIISPSIIRNIDNKTTSDALFELQSTNEVNDFLKSKLEYEKYAMYELGYTKNYIKGSYEVLNWKVIESKFLWCEIAVDVTYQYSDASVISRFGSTIQVVIENPDNPIIIDFYNGSFESFDSQVRSYELDLTDSKNWLSSQNTNEIISNKNKCFESHKAAIVNLKQNMIKTSQENNTQYPAVAPLSTRRGNAVNYALANYNKATPSSGGQSVSFYNFNPGCTEFISHCLLAGGFSQVFGRHLYEDCWYFRSVNDRSSSWAGVNALFGWLSWNGNTGSGPKAVSFFSDRNNLIDLRLIDQPLPIHSESGNIVQIKYNWLNGYGYPNYGHSILVTGFATQSSFPGGYYVTPLATWRTNASSWGVNRKVIDVYPPAPNTTNGSGGHLYRAIHLNY